MAELTGILARFDRAAPTYDSGGVQPAVAARLVAMLPDLAPGAVVLDAGCGTGNLAARLRTRYPDAALWAVDGSPSMLAEAAARLAAAGVRLQAADLWHWEPPCAFDLLASSCVLHWLNPLSAALARLAGWLAPGGRLAGAVMVDGTLGELHGLRAQLGAGGRRLPRAGEVHTALGEAGLQLHSGELQEWTQRAESAAALLRELADQGVTAGWPPLNRRQLADLMVRYDNEHALPDGGVAVTWRVLYFIAESATRGPLD